MCSGCTTLGKSTIFGSGKSRAVPPNSVRAASSFIVVQVLPRIGPTVGRRIEYNLRDRRLIGSEIAAHQILAFRKYFRKTSTHFPPKRFLGKTLIRTRVGGHVV